MEPNSPNKNKYDVTESRLIRALSSQELPDYKVRQNVAKIMNEVSLNGDIVKKTSILDILFSRIQTVFTSRPSFALGMAIILVSALLAANLYLNRDKKIDIANNDVKIPKRITDTSQPEKFVDINEIYVKKIYGAIKIINGKTSREIVSENIGKDGYGLAAGDRLEASGSSSCEVVLAKGSCLLGNGSSMLISEAGVDIARGKVSFKFAPGSFSPASPFVIETNMSEIFILGTELEVSTAMPSGDSINLITGKLGITLKNEKYPISIKLIAGQRAAVSKTGVKITAGAVSILEMVSDDSENVKNDLLKNNGSYEVDMAPVQDASKLETIQVLINDTSSGSSGQSVKVVAATTETDLFSSDFPNESEWLVKLLSDLDTIKKYKSYSRIQLHKMYLKAKQDYEKNRNLNK